MMLLGMMLAAPLCGATPRGHVVHAVTMESLAPRFKDKRTTVDAPCGARVRVLHGTAENSVLPWPPRVASLQPGITRCPECHELTGRKRPNPKVWPR